MCFVNEIKKEIEKKKYKVYEVNLALETVKNGIQFENFEKLQDFIYEQKIDAIFLVNIMIIQITILLQKKLLENQEYI